MKEITPSEKTFSKIFKNEFGVFAIMFLLSISLQAQDILLGQYEFTTGVNQLKATNVATGLSMGDAIIGTGTTPITANYSGDAVETSNWGTSMGISGGKCANISITKLANASEFNVNRIDITLKRTTANKFQINFGATANTYSSKMYSATTLQGTSTYSVISLVEATGTGAIVVPPVSNSNTLFFSIGTMSASSTEVVYIDKIEVYGSVSLISTPTLTTNFTSMSINASKNHSISFPVNLSGANLTGDADISITGTDAAQFSVDKTSIPVATLTSSAQTITVTYPAATTGSHSANLHIESAGASSLDIPIAATCDLLYEDFSNYDATATTTNSLSTLLPITNDVSLARISGWNGQYLYQYKAGSPNLGTVCLGSTSADSAFLTTPEIDLSQPFTLSFKARSLTAGTDGRFSVYLDGTQLVYQGINTGNSMIQQTTGAFVGTTNSKLTFTGRQVNGNEIIIDGIVVNNSSNPALNIPLIKVEDLGSVVQGSTKTLDIPVKGYNLVGDLNISLKYGTNFSLTSSPVISLESATAGSNISVKLTAPGTLGEVSDSLVISSSNLTSRKIALKAVATVSTNLTLNTDAMKVVVNQSNVDLLGFEGKEVFIYNITGAKVVSIIVANEKQTIPLPLKGCYILTTNEAKPFTQKIIK